MHRLSFEETWVFLRDNTNLVGKDEPMPAQIGPAGYDEPESWISYYRCPDIADNGEGDESTEVLKLENLTMPAIFLCRCGVYLISFRNTSLADSSLCWNDFEDVDFTGADLSRCDLRCSDFRSVQFTDANLREADLRMCAFVNCDFTNANMAGTKMIRRRADELGLTLGQLDSIAWHREQGSEPKGG